MNNYNEGYFSLKNNAIIELKAHLLRTYSFIVSKDYKDQGVFYSQAKMADELKISIRSVQRHIKALKELGYLKVKRRGFNMTNLYTIVKKVIKTVKEKKEEMTNNFKKSFANEKTKLRFNNFKGREYSKEEWNSLEKKLLGWE
ncbi:helix-turn-helix domain-containing protein [Clostridium tertium]|uniref:helix-turn-helix domain-containing protein n=1 Tax=Clostridium tertium TaxID=1559 RepID=UPI0023307885|nr:helix-turn-helix domain-containing protein [Clostridium tertium]MDB1931709.1 helix-turn-helix domain-containing protein [Clostridium tertium]MDB1938245.1 helix-turn-helix domain-containing protein [Clostridium tertium]